ncbi:hypothetical protein DCS_05997 [Drechmeria coniospora]|uniref:Uncharacterized protein n=1 Tax=Drechmeria coniospora TaxID=98403 RepID=A0A151GAC4_DRECN|nr:hypothetical protein DCS_05997 [Drechmeria coniospora]KYK54043.1 hypothetical protein DCS_05997 [Drechmeria coniospora]
MIALPSTSQPHSSTRFRGLGRRATELGAWQSAVDECDPMPLFQPSGQHKGPRARSSTPTNGNGRYAFSIAETGVVRVPAYLTPSLARGRSGERHSQAGIAPGTMT